MAGTSWWTVPVLASTFDVPGPVFKLRMRWPRLVLYLDYAGTKIVRGKKPT